MLATVANFCNSNSNNESVFNGKYWLAEALNGITTSAKLKHMTNEKYRIDNKI
jgi:hypothetical protein